MDVVNHYAKEGLRIISVAYKDVKVKNYKEFIKYNRSRAESELIFCGFVFLKNRLKESTAHTIGVLNVAKIVPYMATGDHMQTAIAVGKECCMIKMRPKSVQSGSTVTRNSRSTSGSRLIV